MHAFGGFHRSVARGLLLGGSCSRRPVPVGSATTTAAPSSRPRRRYGAQPAGGDVPVGCLRQVDAVPEQTSRRVLALAGAGVAAENVPVVVEPSSNPANATHACSADVSSRNCSCRHANAMHCTHAACRWQPRRLDGWRLEQAHRTWQATSPCR
jgi:hypothetical protein